MQRRMRYLRHKYNIPIRELSAHSGVCQQRLSQIELGERPGTAQMNELAGTAFRRYIVHKREDLTRLEAELAVYGNRLVEPMEEHNANT